MKPIRVLLADDHGLVRAGIRALLNQMPEVTIVAEASNGREAVHLVDVHRPHIVLMDMMMPEMNGLDATARIVATFPEVRVVILSMNATEQYVMQALQAGASGYVMKDVSPQELLESLEVVSRGDVFLSPIVPRLAASGLKNRNNCWSGSSGTAFYSTARSAAASRRGIHHQRDCFEAGDQCKNG